MDNVAKLVGWDCSNVSLIKFGHTEWVGYNYRAIDFIRSQVVYYCSLNIPVARRAFVGGCPSKEWVGSFDVARSSEMFMVIPRRYRSMVVSSAPFTPPRQSFIWLHSIANGLHVCRFVRPTNEYVWRPATFFSRSCILPDYFFFFFKKTFINF